MHRLDLDQKIDITPMMNTVGAQNREVDKQLLEN